MSIGFFHQPGLDVSGLFLAPALSAADGLAMKKERILVFCYTVNKADLMTFCC
jgi:hypothetical protein